MSIDEEIGEQITLPDGFRPTNGIQPRTETMISPGSMYKAHNASRNVRIGAYILAGAVVLATAYTLLIHKPAEQVTQISLSQPAAQPGTFNSPQK